MNTQHNKQGQPAGMHGLMGELCKSGKHRIARREQPGSLKAKVLRVSGILPGMGVLRS